LFALGPELLLAVTSPSVAALRRQTKTIPVVFTAAVDPVGQGFVETLPRPGGTITGFASYDPPMAGKWLGMLAQIAPPVARVAVLYNSAPALPAGMMHAIEEAAPSLALTVQATPCRDEPEIEAATAAFAREGHGGLLVLPNTFNAAQRDAIVATAARQRLPAIYPFRYYAAAGGLMSYAVDSNDLFRRAASYVDRILQGVKPADLPVQAPIKFELVLNLRTAKALGVTFAPALLATADAVIE
jgi:putative tryptophan/tyrosine transport system substrate-binding protein